MDKEQTLYSFWAGFNTPAYDETRVPEDAPFPRITYETGVDSFGAEVALTASLWYYSTSWADITRKTHEISSAISMGGKVIRTDDGALWIKRGTPFAQRFADNNDSIRRMVLNISVEYFEQN